MVVLDQFYQIVDADTARVTAFWKVAHVFTFLLAAVCGFVTAFTFGQVLDDFNYNCVLDADLAFDNETFLHVSTKTGTKAVRAIDLTLTFWGSSRECNFAQFTPLLVMISSLIWAIYFIILARGGGGYNTDLLSRPLNIVYPCIFFCVITFIVYLISTLKLHSGLKTFCSQFHSELNNEGCVSAINVYTQQFFDSHKDRHRTNYFDFYLNQEIAAYSSQIGVWTWVVQLALLISRVFCVADFDLHLVTVHSKEEEFIEQVIEPDEDGEDDISQV